MNAACESFPSLVHEAAAFIKKPFSILINDDSIRINQHHRRGALAAGIDRFDMHAAPVARDARTLLGSHTDAITGVKTASGRDQPETFSSRAEMGSHHRRVTLKAAGC